MFDADWAAARRDLAALAGPTFDENGEANDPIRPGLIPAVAGWFAALEAEGHVAPFYTTTLAAGYIWLEWCWDDGARMSADVRTAGEAELLHSPPGGPHRFEVRTIAVRTREADDEISMDSSGD